MNRLLYFIRKPWKLIEPILRRTSYFGFLRGTSKYQNICTLEAWFRQKVLNKGGNKSAYWPVSVYSQVFDADCIYAGIDTCPGIMKGCYIQGKGGIYIGDYTQIAPNVVIVSSNHDVYDTRIHIPQPVRIGKYCWLGAGSKIMPGVVLGDFTIVAAGSVVTKSFPDGHMIIAGVPAKTVKLLEKDKCVRYELKPKYYGFLSEYQFLRHLKKHPKIPTE